MTSKERLPRSLGAASAQHRKVFTLLIEMRCNSYCVFCGQREVDEALVQTRRRLGLVVPETKFGDTRGRYTLETATKVLERARADGFTELSLQGGEPTIWPDLPALIRRARALGFDFIGVVTNGRRLRDRAFAAELIDAGLDGLTVSLLGADAETHDSIAAAPGAFDALVEGLANASALSNARGRNVTINANLIATARSIDQLSAQIRLIARAGAQAAQVHLVRFTGLASDPGVREPLRFDIRRMRSALAEARLEAERQGISLHATDVPLCLHPTLSFAEIGLVARRASIAEHHFEAAAFAYEPGGEPHVSTTACAGCVLDSVCLRVPPEYLPDDAGDAFKPITATTVAASIDDALAEIDPRRPDALTTLVDLERSLERLASIGGDPTMFASAVKRLHGALADLARVALGKRDAIGLVASFCCRVGLYPQKSFVFHDAAWDVMPAPLNVLAKRTGGVARERAVGDLRLILDGRFELAIDGDLRDGGLVDVRAAHPIITKAGGADERLWRAVFLVAFAEPVRRARQLRVTQDGIDADDCAGTSGSWRAWRQGSIQLVRASDASRITQAAT